jgi:hypothetical protein
MNQCKLESSNFTSKIALSNNNILGMKHLSQRPNLSERKKNGYAYYKNWQFCLIDYAIWQSRYDSKYKDDEDSYILFLGRIYGEDSSYVNKINSMLDEYRKGD